MYGSQPPSQSYYNTAPPSSYPEWQQNRPVDNGQSWQGSQVSSPPPGHATPATVQPTTTFYNPNMYGPMPGSAASPAVDNSSQSQTSFTAPSPNLNTSSWGVRYNQHHGYQQQQPSNVQGSQALGPPPLPPRPTSGLGLYQSSTQSGQQPLWNSAQQQQPYYPPNPSTPGTEQQQQQQQPHSTQYWQPHSYTDPTPAINQSIPPNPPPIPPAYQAEVQQQAQQQVQQHFQQNAQQQAHFQSTWPNAPIHSTLPPTHNYEPPQQQQPTQPPQPSQTPVHSTLPSVHKYEPLQQQQPTQPPQPSQTPVPQTQHHPAMAQAGPLNYNNYPHPPNHMPNRPPSRPPVEPTLPLSTSPVTSASVALSSGISPPSVAPVYPEPSLSKISTTGASALGLGGPSDWEHFSSGKEEIDDSEAFNFKVELPTAKPNTFHFGQPEVSKPEPQPQRLSTPVEHGRTQPEPAPLPSFNEPEPQRPVSPQRQYTNRMDSVSSFSSAISREDNTGPIDNIILQWSQPVLVEHKPPVNTEPPRVESPVPITSEKSPNRVATPVSQLQPSPLQASPKTSPSVISKVAQPVIQSVTTIEDPYADLDPWYKSSLTRYVTMLRKEMMTESEDEKFKIFSAFMAKESKLREILYNIETEPEVIKAKPADVEPPKPADPPKEPVKPILQQLDTDFPIPVEHEDDVVTYSPGGRPVFASSLARSQVDRKKSNIGVQRSSSNPPPPGQLRNRADSLNISGYIGSPVAARDPLPELPRSTSVPPGASARSSLIALRNTAVYTPFRYQEAPQKAPELLSFDRPAYQAYSALRQASAESGRVMAQPTLQPRRDSNALDIPRPIRAEHDETFLGLVREKSVAYRGKRPGTSLANRPPTADPFKKGITMAILDDIRALVPTVLPNPVNDARIANVQAELRNFPDDFGFVEKSLEAWDRGAAVRQGQIDSQRRVRQEESERHIDALFNDKEIGYSDITVLETEFKQTEAQKQLNEERKEFDKFVEIVFARIDERLGAEIATLDGHYKEALALLSSDPDHSTKAKLGKFHLSNVMKNAIDVFQKIERRHAKRIEAILEQERRKKRAKRRYFVFLGDTPALKQMDKQFEAAEKRILLDAANARDDRANQLMDAFDEASMRGIGENQRLLDDISIKVEKFDPSLISDKHSLPPQARAILTAACEFVRFLGGDSESILTSFGVADRLLNNADYEVSVAEARVANAGADIFRRLEEEKKKEDRKIGEDLESRMSDVRRGHQEILKSIEDVLSQMQKNMESFSSLAGKGNGNGGGPGTGVVPAIGLDGTPLVEAMPVTTQSSLSTPLATPSPGEEDGQQERLRRALEEAKKRNAAKKAS